MNCKPGDLARVVGLPKQLQLGNNRIVQLKKLPPIEIEGCACWVLEDALQVTLVGKIKTTRDTFKLEEPVCLDALPDIYLRPIHDPGDDAQDETLTWLPVPSREGQPA